ncbi:MAG: hypothetical protein ABJZ55_24115 [Fuerstiella sp.]
MMNRIQSTAAAMPVYGAGLRSAVMRVFVIFTVAVCTAASAGQIQAGDLDALKSVGQFSKGTRQAKQASEALVAGGAKNLLPLLQAFDGASPLAANWLRSTFETIADSQIKAGQSLPKDQFLAFIKDSKNSPAARRLAYEWLLIRRPELKDQLIPGMLSDPSPEFRRDAVAVLLADASKADGKEATVLYQKALQGAVHEDQVKTISKALRGSGIEVDLQTHFGFLTNWKIIGPFNNKEGVGYAADYPPESEIEVSAEYEGQLGTVKWETIQTDDDFGLINIAEDVKNYKGSVMYVTATYRSASDMPVEFRLGTPNAWKLWVNGKLQFEREEYHRSTKMDQYQISVPLKSGQNRILLKLCQNEQTQSWAQKYQFQLRVSDTTGAAVLPSVTTATK